MVNCNLKECDYVEMEATTDDGIVLYTCPKCGNEVTVPEHRKPIKKKWFRREKYDR